jgi:hypothetical protein
VAQQEHDTGTSVRLPELNFITAEVEGTKVVADTKVADTETEVADMESKQFETMFEMQKELFGNLEELNRSWVARIQSQLEIAFELVGKLTATRSIPDAATAYQECMSRQMEGFAEDGRRLFADGQKFMSTVAQLLPKGSVAGGV